MGRDLGPQVISYRNALSTLSTVDTIAGLDGEGEAVGTQAQLS